MTKDRLDEEPSGLIRPPLRFASWNKRMGRRIYDDMRVHALTAASFVSSPVSAGAYDPPWIAVRQGVHIMKALFADLSERTRQHCEDRHVYKANERRQVIALCDAIQVAVAEGQQHQVSVLLRDMRVIVDTALARRRAPPLRIDV